MAGFFADVAAGLEFDGFEPRNLMEGGNQVSPRARSTPSWGPNGAGKTTTVRMLVTLLLPTEGRAMVAGHDVVSDAAAVRRAIGVALQEAALDPLMTGRELIALQAMLHGLPRRQGRRRAEALLERVGLTAAADRRVGTYSGGMRRRLDLAMALVNEPQVLFLDEPTTGLDPTSRVRHLGEVRRLNGEGTTVFLTTQYLEEADQLADRVGIIDHGRMAAEGHARRAQGPGRAAPARGRARRGRPSERARQAVAPFGDVLPGTDGTLMVALRRGRGEVASDGAGAGRRRAPRGEPPSTFRERPRHWKRRLRRAYRPAPVSLHADLRVVGALGRRSLRQTFRRPQFLAPILLFPSLFLAVNTGGAGRAVELPGSPRSPGSSTSSSPARSCSRRCWRASAPAIALALDIEMGFLDRLVAAPIARWAIVLGRLAATAALGCRGGCGSWPVGLIFGAEVQAGAVGVLVVLVLAAAERDGVRRRSGPRSP